MGYTVDGKDFAAYKTITPTRPDAALTDYPLKVGIVADANVGGRCLSTGADVRFTLVDGTLLYSEKNDFLITAGAATGNFWVNVPSLPSGADTVINMYYGCPTAAAQTNPELTWNSYHKLALLMPDGETLGLLDSTARGNNFTNSGATATLSGRIQSGAAFGGAGYIYGSGEDFKVGTGDFCVSFWVYPTSFATEKSLLDFLVLGGQGDRFNAAILVLCSTTGKLRWFTVQAYGATSNGALTINTWNHIAWVRASGVGYFYINGAVDSVTPSLTTDITSGGATTGRYSDGADGWLIGNLDQLMLQAVNPGADWVAYDFLTQNTAAGGLIWGAETESVAYNIPIGIMMV
jgi:hypothetical protein